MSFIADFHIHSKYSRATSKDMDIPNLTLWAKKKGITLMGTGDFTHPAWLSELKTHLKPADNGLLEHDKVKYILTTEVCNIFFKDGKTRKIHNMIFVPSFEIAEKLNRQLEKYADLASDGRPIFGTLSARDLLEIVLRTSDDCFLVPAHIWTPWFSLFGANSGFDTIEECFGDLSEYVWSLETGLSSDPAMNWRLSKLDKYTLISNSDAHSPAKIGREANFFDCPMDYENIIGTLKNKDRDKFLMTVEFFPEEGKYHYDGHRKCNALLSPAEAKLNRNICPICGRKITIGVMHRVDDLADRPEGFLPENRIPFKNLIPLIEVISEVMGVSSTSKGPEKEYRSLVEKLGNEFDILMNVTKDDLLHNTSSNIAQGILAVREAKVNITPGYDGEYGKIEIIKTQSAEDSDQLNLF
jgi:uncharacterized protein (TIGR00375 family)